MSIMAFTALGWIEGQFCSGSYIWYIFAYMWVFLKYTHNAMRHQMKDGVMESISVGQITITKVKK